MYYPILSLDIYSNIVSGDEYAVDPDFEPYPMTEAEIGEYRFYEALARDEARAMGYE